MGTMWKFDSNFSNQSVSKLQELIAKRCQMPMEKQVLLVSGGENVSSHNPVSSYFAGTDTNPFFLFNKNVLDFQFPPFEMPSQMRDKIVLDQLGELMLKPPSFEIVTSITKILQSMCEISRQKLEMCLELVHSQHLQHQGWLAVIANLLDISNAYLSRSELFLENLSDFLLKTPHFHTIIEKFPQVLDLLRKVPLLPCLPSLVHQHLSISSSSSSSSVSSTPHHQIYHPPPVSTNPNNFPTPPTVSSNTNIINTDVNVNTATSSVNNTMAGVVITNVTTSNSSGGTISSSSNSFSTLPDPSKSFFLNNLLDWINAQDCRCTLEQMADQCRVGLEQFTDLMKNSQQSEMEKVKEFIIEDKREMKTIKGLDERLAGLDKLMANYKQMVKKQEEIANVFINFMNRNKNIQDSFKAAEFVESHRKQVDIARSNHHQLIENSFKCFKTKHELCENLNSRLRWVMLSEQSLCEADNRLIIKHEALKRLKQKLDIINQISLSAFVFFSSVAEVYRRKKFAKSFIKKALKTSEKYGTIYQKEVKHRKSFDSKVKIHKHFLKALFPGLNEDPPSFAAKFPDDFDKGLPDIQKEDLEFLKKSVPELSELLTFEFFDEELKSGEDEAESENAEVKQISSISVIDQVVQTEDNSDSKGSSDDKFSKNGTISRSFEKTSTRSSFSNEEFFSLTSSSLNTHRSSPSTASSTGSTSTSNSSMISTTKSCLATLVLPKTSQSASFTTQKLFALKTTNSSTSSFSSNPKQLVTIFSTFSNTSSTYTISSSTNPLPPLFPSSSSTQMPNLDEQQLAYSKSSSESEFSLYQKIDDLQTSLQSRILQIDEKEKIIKKIKSENEKKSRDLEDSSSHYGQLLEFCDSSLKEFRVFLKDYKSNHQIFMLEMTENLNTNKQNFNKLADEVLWVLIKKEEENEQLNLKIKINEQNSKDREKEIKEIKQNLEVSLTEKQKLIQDIEGKKENIRNLEKEIKKMTLVGEVEMENIKSELIEKLKTKEMELSKVNTNFNNLKEELNSLSSDKEMRLQSLELKIKMQKDEELRDVKREYEKMGDEYKTKVEKHYETELIKRDEKFSSDLLEMVEVLKNLTFEMLRVRNSPLLVSNKQEEQDSEDLEVSADQIRDSTDLTELMGNMSKIIKQIQTNQLMSNEEIYLLKNELKKKNEYLEKSNLNETPYSSFTSQEDNIEPTSLPTTSIHKEVQGKPQSSVDIPVVTQPTPSSPALMNFPTQLDKSTTTEKKIELSGEEGEIEVEDNQYKIKQFYEEKLENLKEENKKEIEKISFKLSKEMEESKEKMKCQLEKKRQISFNLALNQAIQQRDIKISDLEDEIDRLQKLLPSSSTIYSNTNSSPSSSSPSSSSSSFSSRQKKSKSVSIQTEKSIDMKEKVKFLWQKSSWLDDVNSSMSSFTQSVDNFLPTQVAPSLLDKSTINQLLMQQSCPSLDVEEKIFSLENAVKNKEEENRKLKHKLTQLSMNKMSRELVHDHVSILNCSEGSITLFVFDAPSNQYTAYLSDNNIKHFLHSESVAQLTQGSSSSPPPSWLVAEITTKELCQATKPNNRFKIPVGTKFFRVKAKSWIPSKTK